MVAQFSWTRERHGNPRPDDPAWTTAVRLAHEAMDPSRPQPDPTSGALFFHASYVAPDWSLSGEMDFLTRIGDHLFYRNRGQPADAGSMMSARSMVALPSIRPLPRFTPASVSGVGGAGPGDLLSGWNRKGAKLIRLAAGSSPGTVSVRTYEKGRVLTMQLARERN